MIFPLRFLWVQSTDWKLFHPITKNLPAITVSEGFSCLSADIQFVALKPEHFLPVILLPQKLRQLVLKLLVIWLFVHNDMSAAVYDLKLGAL